MPLINNNTSEQSQQYYLLRLPLELRLLIYDYVIPENTYDFAFAQAASSEAWHETPNLQLPRTCRALYNEALPVIYNKSVFVLHPEPGSYIAEYGSERKQLALSFFRNAKHLKSMISKDRGVLVGDLAEVIRRLFAELDHCSSAKSLLLIFLGSCAPDEIDTLLQVFESIACKGSIKIRHVYSDQPRSAKVEQLAKAINA